MIAGAAESDITVRVLTAAGGGGVRAVLDVAAVEDVLHLDVGAALYKLPQRRARHSAQHHGKSWGCSTHAHHKNTPAAAAEVNIVQSFREFSQMTQTFIREVSTAGETHPLHVS